MILQQCQDDFHDISRIPRTFFSYFHSMNKILMILQQYKEDFRDTIFMNIKNMFIIFHKYERDSLC